MGSTGGDAKLVSALEATMDRIDGGQLLSKAEYPEAVALLVTQSS